MSDPSPQASAPSNQTPANHTSGWKSWRVKTIAISITGLGAMVGIAGVGYLFSDAQALNGLAQRERLDTPSKVFAYVTSHWQQAQADDPVRPGESLQSMLGRPNHRLWCDEGALVLALLNQRLNRQTRLVDLLDARTGISHHTTMQVQDNGRWVTYDFTSKRSGIPLAATVTYDAVPRYRPYPASALHWILLHNTLARALVERYRGIER